MLILFIFACLILLPVLSLSRERRWTAAYHEILSHRTKSLATFDEKYDRVRDGKKREAISELLKHLQNLDAIHLRLIESVRHSGEREFYLYLGLSFLGIVSTLFLHYKTREKNPAVATE